MFTLGIDCHKKYSQVAVLNTNGQCKMEVKMPNNKESFTRLLNELEEPCQAVIEAGYSWGVMYDILTELGVDVTVAHALRVKAIASAKIKTDTIDARTLAELLRAGLIPEIYIANKDVRRQRNILRQRCWLVRIRTMIKNRIHSVLVRNHVEPPGFSDIFCVAGRKFLASLELPSPDDDILKQDLLFLEEVNEHIKQSEQWIERTLSDNHYRAVIQTIPGFGKILSALVSLEIDNINRFPYPAKLSAYAGLVPTTYASGGKTYHGSLLPNCNRWLRYAFIEASWTIITHSHYFRALYQRIKIRKGPQAAISATARRLSEVVYHCLKDNRAYEERPYFKRAAA